MAYNPINQYRCDIVRSKTIRLIEDILAAYAKIIHDLCPCSEDDFIDDFNSRLSIYLKALGKTVNTKALNNHRTEIAKTLFGMYYVDSNNVVYETDRTQKFLKDNDQPAFFKDICYKLQFPNGMTINSTINERIKAGIKSYPCRLVLSVLEQAQTTGVKLTVRDIGYYVLNSLDALSGISTPKEIVDCIIYERSVGTTRNISSGRKDSYDWQHIEGILDYLYLANLIDYSNSTNKREREVILNVHETSTIKLFTRNYADPLEFDVYDTKKHPRDTVNERKVFQIEWDKFNGELSKYATSFITLPSCLGISSIVPMGGVKKSSKIMTLGIGKSGESYVEEYEKDLLKKINPSYVSLVINKSSQRGIGYDIESKEIIKGTLGGEKYIEVKTTTRVTKPAATSFIDSITLTKNEWLAAKKYKSKFYIYRVYLTKGNVIIYKLKNISKKFSSSIIDVEAPKYDMRFDLMKPGVVDDTAII